MLIRQQLTLGQQLPDLLETYAPRDIYNTDETGIYFRALPDGSLTFSNDKLSGTKKSKERITALVTTNMDGTDKETSSNHWKSQATTLFPWNFISATTIHI